MFWKYWTKTWCSGTFTQTSSQKTSQYEKFDICVTFHPDPDLWDHPDTGTGVRGGLSDGGPVQGETLRAPVVSGLRVHRNQSQPSRVSVMEQHEKISGEYLETLKKKKIVRGNFARMFGGGGEGVGIFGGGVIIEKMCTNLMTDFSSSCWIPRAPPTKGKFAVCVAENDESLLSYQLHLACPSALRVTPDQERFPDLPWKKNEINWKKKNRDEDVYLLLIGRWMICSGDSRRTGHPRLDPPLAPSPPDWVRCVNVCADPPGRADVLTSQAAHNRPSVITVTWESCTARSVLTGRTHCLCRDTNHFVLPPASLLEFIESS